MKKYLYLLISCAFLTSCATIKPVVDIMPIPPKPESSLPMVKNADKEVDNSISKNVELSKKIEAQKQNITEQKKDIVEAIASAEKIKEKALAQKAITEIEAVDLIDQLNKIDSRNMFLETANGDLNKTTVDQEKSLRLVKESLSIAEAQIAVVENDANNLRDRLKATNDVLSNKNVEIETLKNNLTKEKQISASALVYKRWVIGLASFLVLWIIAKVVLTIYCPLSKFKL